MRTATRVATSAVDQRRAPGPSPRTRSVIGYALLALLAYVPALLTAPGNVAADTKQYLYLDPARMLSRAPSMWDPNIGLGTVTHQNIGYLFPMGPYYWLMDRIGFPDWFAQRIWLGTILFAAGVGMLYLLRTLGMRGPGAVAAALVFMLSPYSLDYAARISVILLPWAGLPWMVALVVRALREGGWRYPAAFALVVQIVGGVNATALVFAGIAPLLWVPYSVVVTREVDWRRALATVARIGVLTVAASLWWIAGLAMQGGYGLNILRYTETVETVATASVAPEVLRGLGYWFFYGRDKVGPWIEAGIDYTQREPLILVGYILPTLAVLSAVLVRWRYRAYFAGVALVGMAFAVGAHPYDDPSPFGALFKASADRSTAALALRSTGRAVPLVVLGVAVLLGAGVNALHRALEGRGFGSRGVLVAAGVGVLAVANLPALWNDTFYGKDLQRPEEVPGYWHEAAASLDAGSHDTRILEIPGADFASYRWGNTVDPITPGLVDRPWVARELIPWGSPASANLLNALDRRLQEGLLDPEALTPIARLMGVGDIVVRSDLQTDRYNTARPRATWDLLNPPPTGLGSPETHGTDLGPDLGFPLLDELTLRLPAGAPEPPPVAIFPVEDARPVVRAASADAPLVVAGDGEGLVSAAGVGLLDRAGVVLYSASYADDPEGLARELGRDAVLVVTDSNRRQARRWSTVRENLGHTERAGEEALRDDPADTRLDVFPEAGADAYTVADQRGAHVTATRYGNPITYTPEDRAVRAVDGDARTAWRVGGFSDVTGERIRVDLEEPITTDHVELVQPLAGPRDRYITRATLRFDGEEVTVGLGPESQTPEGQRVEFSKRTFESFELEVDEDNIGFRADYGGVSPVGLAEIRLRDDGASEDVRVREVVRMPTDLLDAAGRGSLDHELVLLMTRARTVLVPPRFSEDEEFLDRAFELPGAREFALGGTARLSTAAPDETIDALLGLPGPSAGGLAARSSDRIPGDVRARASSAVDGDAATAWSTPFGAPVGNWVEVDVPEPVAFERLDLQVVADGRHSVPTRVRVDAGGQARTVDVPAIEDRGEENATVTVPLTFDPLTGDRIRVTIEEIRPITTLEYYSVLDVVMPVALAELGIPGGEAPPLPPALPGECRADLVTLDGRAVPVRVTGDRVAAEARDRLSVELCDPAGVAPRPRVALGAGDHELVSAPGRVTGLDVDEVVLGSAAGGAPHALGAFGAVPTASVPGRAGRSAATPGGAPTVTVEDEGRTSMKLRVEGAEAPFWLVLGQSDNDGWRASVDGHDLGRSQLVDGYANGWLVPGDLGGGDLEVTLTWTPQRLVWIAIGISGLAMLACTALALRGRRRPGHGAPRGPGVEPALTSPLVAGGTRPPFVTLVAAPLGAAVVAGVLVRPWAGLLVGALVLGALVRPRLRVLLTAGAPLAIGAAGLYIVVQNSRYDYPPLFEWPTFFDSVHVLGWLAVVLLAADALVEVLRERGRHDDAATPTAEP